MDRGLTAGSVVRFEVAGLAAAVRFLFGAWICGARGGTPRRTDPLPPPPPYTPKKCAPNFLMKA